MWIMTTFGFFSIVCAGAEGGGVNPRLCMVRARKRAHLEAMRKRYPTLPKIQDSNDTDYPHRIITSKSSITAIIMNLAEGIDYGNFKNEAKKTAPEDHAYHTFLGSVWGLGLHMSLARGTHWQPYQTPNFGGWATPNTHLPKPKARIKKKKA